MNKIKQVAEKEIKETGGLRDIIRTAQGPIISKSKTNEQKKIVTYKLKSDSS